MQSYADYIKDATGLRNDIMVAAWIADYQNDKWNRYPDCKQCSFPHSPHLLCNGATFGRARLGWHTYYINLSNVVFFHEFVSSLSQGGGFHWHNEIFFKRDTEGNVEVRHLEPFNNCPQIKKWRIDPNSWDYIVASVSEKIEQKPVAWLHEVKEPDSDWRSMLSRHAEHPWSHWIEKHKAECEFKSTPLYAAPLYYTVDHRHAD